MAQTDMIATTVIRAVAAADGVDPSDLDPLYEYLDPDVLEQLSDQDQTSWRFTFQYLDHQVTVTHEIQVLIDGTAYTPDISTE